MTKVTNFSKYIFMLISLVIISICVLLSFLNLYEYYYVGLMNQIKDYPFGAEGPTPYYYKSADLYAKVNLVWGVVFLMTLIFTVWNVIKSNRKQVNRIFIVLLLLLFVFYIHGQIGT